MANPLQYIDGIPVRIVTRTTSENCVQAEITCLNPTSGHYLTQSHIDTFLHRASGLNGSRILRTRAVADSAEAAVAAAKAQMPRILSQVGEYYRTLLPHFPVVGSDLPNIYPLCESFLKQRLSGAEATRIQNMRTIKNQIVPLFTEQELYSFDLANYEDALTKINSMPVGRTRRAELIRLLRTFLDTLYTMGILPLSPTDLPELPVATRTEKMEIASQKNKRGSRVVLSEGDRQLLFKSVQKLPDSSVSPLAINLMYDGLSLADMVLCRFKDLHVVSYMGHQVMALSVPDSGSNNQPFSRVRCIPLSRGTTALLQARLQYWAALYVTKDPAILLELPLLSSRRLNPRMLSIEDVMHQINQDGEEHIKKLQDLIGKRGLYQLVLADAHDRIVARIGVDEEQQRALLGLAQITVDGAHYDDLYASAALTSTYYKMLRSPIGASSPVEASSVSTTGVSHFTVPAGVQCSYICRCDVPRGTRILVRTSIAAHCRAREIYKKEGAVL